LRQTRRSFLGNVTSEQQCDKCFGVGELAEESCKACGGSTVLKRAEDIKIAIPSGIQDGEMIRLTGMGEATPHGTSGDLYVKIHVEPHKVFKRDSSNLIMDLEVKLTDALTGSTYAIETLDGELKVKIPAGVSYDEHLRIKGHGVPVGDKRGDLLIRIIIKTPSKLSKKALKLVEELQKEGL